MMKTSGIVVAGFVAAVLCGCASGPAGVRPEIRDEAGQEPTVTGALDLVTIAFQLRDADLTAVSVRVEYQEGGVWRGATLTASSEGAVSGNTVTGIRPTADWTAYSVIWDSWADGAALAGATAITIRLTPYDIDGGGDPVEATATIDNHFPAVSVAESEITFTHGLGAAMNPPGQSISISNSGAPGTTLNWTASVTYVTGTPGWLSPSPGSGAATVETDTVDLTANPVGLGLGEGTYTASVEVSDPLAHDDPQTVLVTLTVLRPELSVDTSAVTFSHQEGSPANPASESVYVTNLAPAGTLDWTVTVTYDPGASGWLTALPASGTTTTGSDEVVLTADLLGRPLVPGVYTATVEVADPQAQGSPACVAVELTVTNPPGLMAYWKLDETSGTTATDSSGNGNDGTLVGMDPATDWVSGKIGGALDFDGIDDRVSFTSSEMPTTTIAAWVNMRGTGTSGAPRIVRMPAYFLLFLHTEDHLNFAAVRDSTPGAWQVDLVLIGTGWHHLAASYDSTSLANDATMYVDGSPAASVEIGTPAGNMVPNTGTAEIGNAGSGRPFDGLLDDVRVYNRVLSAAEIQALYDAGQ